MKHPSIQALKRIAEQAERREELKELLATDPRKGARDLLNKIIRQEELHERLWSSYHEKNRFEKAYYDQGFTRILGMDEVGRGPLAGPLVCAAVILDPQKPILGLDDSKRLSARKREQLSHEIREKSVYVDLIEVNESTIDQINILEATKRAFFELIKRAKPMAQAVLIDAVPIHTSLSSQSIVKGDQRSNSIAAASIIAKVYRDTKMIELSSQYPEYHWESNKGYGSHAHCKAIIKYGITPHHRKSFLKNIPYSSDSL